MKNLDQWLELYGVSHQNPTNKFIHKVCVPAIMLSLLGLLWCIPTPELFGKLPFLNWSTLFMVLCFVFFYLRLSLKVSVLMAIMVVPMFLLIGYADGLGLPLVHISWIIFVVAWIGQFIGHKIEGKKPSFFNDLQFLLVGPIWVIKGLLGK